MVNLRIDYMTNKGVRGTWAYESEYPDLPSGARVLAETFDRAKKRMPEIDHLILVQVSEFDRMIYKGEQP